MAINKIISEKQLNYIETLYLYARLEDFMDYVNTSLDHHVGVCASYRKIQALYREEKYGYMLDWFKDNLLHTGKFIGEAKGRSWYEFENYRLGIMPFQTAHRAKQFNVEIQYTQSHMFSLGEKLENLELPFGGTFEQYHIRRIDISQIVKTPNDYLTDKKFISSYRAEDRITKNGIVETVYLGHRKNGNVFRMYNKSIELLTDNKDHPIDHKKIEIFSKYFGDIDNLYTFELELHRKYLKANYGIETLEHLSRVYDVYHGIVGKIGIYNDDDKNKRLVKNNHRDRLELTYFTEYKECKRVNQKRYKPSKNYAVDRAVRAIEGYEKSMGGLSESEKLLIMDEVAYRMVGKNVDIHISPSEWEEQLEKFQRNRDNQTNALEIEARKEFAPIKYQRADDVF